MDMIELDGSQGEGGGQILRTALTLSMITGTPFRIERIRAKRSKPGLLRQHLTAVNAAAAICGAQVQGAEAASLALMFAPGKIRGGDFRFAIGTAGSCTLVLQTILPALWFADASAEVYLSGGTHNPAAPPADFLIRSWLPLLKRMGVEMEIELLRHGFYPAGGGEIRARVRPVGKLQALELIERGELQRTTATSIVAGVSRDVASRELKRVRAQLGPVDEVYRVLPANEGPGNALMIELDYAVVTEIFTGFGERGLSAERVADLVGKEARGFRDGVGAVGEHLADQLVLPLALAGGGAFTTTVVSEHLTTNIAVIEKFLPVGIELAEREGMARVSVHAQDAG